MNKHMETIKNNQYEIKNSILQIKSSTRSMANTVEQVENRVSGMEDKIEEVDQMVKDQNKMVRKYEWNMHDIWDTMKRPHVQIMGKEGEEIQTKSTDNLFNGIIAENFPTLKKERITQVQEAYKHETIRTKRETHHNLNI
jgi:uncharacterized coiled-coil protein SlyX